MVSRIAVPLFHSPVMGGFIVLYQMPSIGCGISCGAAPACPTLLAMLFNRHYTGCTQINTCVSDGCILKELSLSANLSIVFEAKVADT